MMCYQLDLGHKRRCGSDARVNGSGRGERLTSVQDSIKRKSNLKKMSKKLTNKAYLWHLVKQKKRLFST